MMVPKFRAWDKKTKEYFHISELWNSGTNPECFNFDGWTDNFGNKGRLKDISIEQYTRVKDISIEQYTRVKDANGKEIYEGDVVRMQRPGFHERACYEVKYFVQDVCIFQIVKVTDGSTLFELPSNGRDVEIVGNVHEGPELLEADE